MRGLIVGVILGALAVTGGASAQVLQASLHHFPKWVDVLDRTRAEGLPDQLHRLADRLQGQSGTRQLAAIADWVQLFPYLSDRSGWGQSDYWASPAEFIQRGGDCEDAAIAAYFVLELLGVPASQRAVAVVQDERRDLVHAVTQVVIDGEIWVIDQLAARPMRWQDADHYTVHYIINDRWWSTEALAAPFQIAQVQ